MSRVKLVERDEAGPEVKEIYGRLDAHGARVINLYKAMAQSPEVLRGFLRLGNALLTETKLAGKLRELAILRVAKITGSEYEWAQHYAFALEVGVTQEQAEQLSVWRSSKSFTPEERAVLQYVDEVAVNVAPKEETFKELQKYLDEQCIVELTMSVGFWGMLARFLIALQTDVDVQTASSAQELTGRKTLNK
ncbi:MAG: carboxymuconolactone decarboxylase family protein [Chloroflexi bacterium]|nr:carboxymuconolactone decarboxylase family protein [Chloroflexota bacterium]